MKREIKKIKGKKEEKKAFFNSIKENVASCTASNQQTQGSVVARGVPWLPTCTPRVPPAPVIPPPCPATTALGARTWALGPTNPPGTTCTMPGVETSGGAKASRMHLNPRDLGTSLLSQKSSQRGQGGAFLAKPEPRTQTSTERGRDDGGVGEPSSGMLKGENTATTYTHHRILFIFFSLMSSQNHLENFLIPSHDPWREQPPQRRLPQSQLTSSKPHENAPKNGGLQEILINLTAFKALIKIRSSSSAFFSSKRSYIFSNIIPACTLHCNSP